MKKLIALSAVAMLLAAGCASHETNKGGGFDNTGSSADYNTTHPGTTLGTNPSEDSQPAPGTGGTMSKPDSSSSGSGASSGNSDATDNPTPPEASPQGQSSDESDQAAPREGNSADENSPDDNSPSSPPPNGGLHDNGSNENGPGELNLRHTILMIPI